MVLTAQGGAPVSPQVKGRGMRQQQQASNACCVICMVMILTGGKLSLASA